MLAVRAKPGGIEIEFTEPVDLGVEDIFIEQWRYESTAGYGGPKIDRKRLKVQHLVSIENGKKVDLTISDILEGSVLYLRLDPSLTSKTGTKLWAGECWYTMNQIPREVENI